MHEFSLAENIFKVLKEIKNKENVSRITKVNVKSGAMLHVVPETLSFAFDTIKKDTEFKETILNFEVEPLKLECRKCREVNIIERNNLVCPNCKSDDVEIKGSKDFVITSIDAE